VTLLFKADVDAQSGAYATGVLALMTSAAIAVTLSARRRGEGIQWAFMMISLVFAYTTVVNVIEQPEGMKIAMIFIIVIVLSPLVSRVWRSTELRVDRIDLDGAAREFVRQAAKGTIRIITIDVTAVRRVNTSSRRRRSVIITTFRQANQYFFSKSRPGTLLSFQAY